MTSTRVALLLGAALVCGNVAGASAADLYGGGSTKDTYMAPAPVRSGPAWYFRLDGTYSSYDRSNILFDGVANLYDVSLKNTWGIGGGVGMYLFRGIRGDLTFDHYFKSDVTGTAGANIIGAVAAGNGQWIHAKAPIGRELFLANLYYDFDTGSRFTPYIGGGVGFVQHKFGSGTLVQDNLAPPNTGTIDSRTTTNVAGALMAGFTMQLTGHSGGCCVGGSTKDAVVVESGRSLLLDVGYRYLMLGDAHTGDTHMYGKTNDPVIEDVRSHELRLGLRYNLQ